MLVVLCNSNANIVKGIVGLAKGNDGIINMSFDILSLEALLLVPRYSITIVLLMSLIEADLFAGRSL